MEIKQGDKVRVSGHYIAMMITDGIVHNALNNATFVVDNIDRKGRMAYVSCKLPISLQSPIAHLIKVDAEAKEPKYHKGDRIKFKNIYELQKVKDKSFRWMLMMFASKEATITAVEDGGFYRVDIDPSIGGINDDMIECKVELMEQTEAENQAFTLGERVVTPYGYGVVGKDIEGRIAVALENGGFCGIDKAIKIIADNPVFDWDAYAADLAKELAIAYGKRGESPLDAVAAAKEITKRLKQK